MSTLQPYFIQDAGPRRSETLLVPTYHTHGYRQYKGTSKQHADIRCRHLRDWKPGRQFNKTFMREWHESYDSVPKFSRCRRCWPKKGEESRAMEANANIGNSRTLPIKIGGLMRCCIDTLDSAVLKSEEEGTVLECRHCKGSMRVRNGKWEWNR